MCQKVPIDTRKDFYMNKKAALLSLGCKVNSYETEYIREDMIASGFEIVDFSEKADVYIINTCSVTNIADRKSRQMLHRAKTLNPDALIVATGCYVQTRKEEELKSEADLIIGNNHKGEVAHIIREYFDKTTLRYSVIAPVASVVLFVVSLQAFVLL